MEVPLVDLAWQHDQIAAEVDTGLKDVFSSTSFVHGPHVGRFESEFAAFSGTQHCVGVGNGTDALEMAVRALGLGPSDTVIVPANTFIASALGVLRAGARVKLVDCQPDTYLIDPDQAMAAVDSSVRAVMPVHLYGQMAQMEDLQFPERVAVIEDAAQSQGAARHGRGMGSFGRVAATSFYPGKNIGAYGDAGAVLTDDDALADQVRRLGNWGSAQKYHHPELGFNSRLDTVQAVVLSAKLERLAAWNEMRNAAAARYAELLAEEERVTLPVTLDGNLHVWHLYVIRVPRRDLVLARLHESGIGAGVHYPVPMYLQGALSGLGYGPGSFPVTEQATSEILSLPIFPGITDSQQERVAAALRQALGS